MRRTCDAIASLDRPARGCDHMAGKGEGSGTESVRATPTLDRERGGFAPDPCHGPERLDSHTVRFSPRNVAGTRTVPLQIEAHFDDFALRFGRDFASGPAFGLA